MPTNPELYRLLSGHYLDLPHCRAIGLQHQGHNGSHAVLCLPWQPHLTGHPVRQSIHGGIVTTLVDTASACAVAARLEQAEHLATLDIRIDHICPAEYGRTLYCAAECHRLAGQVAFVRSVCYHDSPDNPVSLGTATFMRTPIGAAEQHRLRDLLATQP